MSLNKSLIFGGIVFHFLSNKDFCISNSLAQFINDEQREESLDIYISDEWEKVSLPKSNYIGQDAINNYYIENNLNYCVSRGGPKGFISCTIYDNSYNKFVCYMNEKPFMCPIKDLSSIIRLLPINDIFLHYRTLFLHSSQIAYKGKGIIFTGPSGIGKTTQAKLWEEYCNADIICNDRTLINKVDEKWETYGFPIDGSSPVRSNEVNELGAIVLLQQSQDNHIEKISIGKCISLLYSQLVINGWNKDSRELASNLLIELVNDIPVYYYSCKADNSAAMYLRDRLVEDGVLCNE